MIEAFINFSAMVFVSLVVFYIFDNMYNISKNNIINWILKLIVFPLVLLFLFLNVMPLLRMCIIILLYIMISCFIYNNNLKLAIIDSLYIEIICILSEAIYTSFYLLSNMSENLMIWNHSLLGLVLSNIIIPLLMVMLSKVNFFKKLREKLIVLANSLAKFDVFFYVIFFFVIINILLYSVYFLYYSNKALLFMIVSVVMILYTIILVVILSTRNRFETIKSKYSMSLESLKSYEGMLNQYKVANHENKNQLLLIRNMSKNKKLNEYIDKLIDNKEKDDNNIYNKIKMIPSNSIRAALYSKILLISNKKISYNIAVDRKISSKDFINLSVNTILDICNILNVFIDNAIDEVSNYEDGQILVEFNKINDEIEIAVSNTCRNDIHMNKLYDEGYSTKGNDHGYGLVVVKNTCDASSIIRNKTEFINNIFTQYIYIKTK